MRTTMLKNKKSQAQMVSNASTYLVLLATAGTSLSVAGSLAFAQDQQAVTANQASAGSQVHIAGTGTVPFSISVDGQVVDASGNPTRGNASLTAGVPADLTRKADVGLQAVDIQVKFDGLEQHTLLNVSTLPIRQIYREGANITFLATSNYPAFIKRAEVRIQQTDQQTATAQTVIIPIAVNNQASWTMPAGQDNEFSYVLRVYDEKGRFDETKPLFIRRSSKDLAPAPHMPAPSPGNAEDRTAVQNIPVSGGAVTVFGRNLPPGYQPEAFNERIPVDAKRSFVVQRILPPGQHQIDVAVRGPSKTGGLRFSRAINIPANDWFFVALADLTVGHQIGDDGLETVRDGEYDRTYTKGRGAFYLKGKIKGEYLLTAAADTGEGDIKTLFRGLDAKDPKQLLRRIDPNEYYPVYGDDSVAAEDAPTSGKFFVRLERGDSEVMWGNYKTRITGTQFMRFERGLYGANAVYRSEDVISSGEHRTEAVAYAALSESLPQRDEFLATGGSVYFLKRQDVMIGSETLTVEIRDAITNEVITRRVLAEGEDYSFDYLQGVIILAKSLSAAALPAAAVRGGSSRVYLVAEYEYTPLLEDVDGYAHGGRVQRWVTDKLRVGVTQITEKTGTADQVALGGDVKLKLGSNSSVEGELAHSKGPGFGLARSSDGGLTLSDVDPTTGQSANAWRAKANIDLADLRLGGLRGSIDAFYEDKKAGFSTTGEATSVDQRTWEAHSSVELSNNVTLKAGHRDFADGTGQVRNDSDVELTRVIDKSKTITVGAKRTQLYSPRAIAAGKSGYDGERVDTGLRAEYRSSDGHTYYAFLQGTVGRSGDIDRNDRLGVGTHYQLTEKIGLSGEASYGSAGLGAEVGATYSPAVNDSYYLGYRLDPDRSHDFSRQDFLQGTDSGSIVAGARRKINDNATAYVESNYDMFGRRVSLSQTYGVNYTPDALWTISTGFETGEVDDDTIDDIAGIEHPDFHRDAVSLSASYFDPDTDRRWRIRGEARSEDADDGSRNLETYLVSMSMSWKGDDNWRVLVDFDGVTSDGSQQSFWGGDYVEASLGFAYRPVDNDRLNGLLKYTYLTDLPAQDQISAISGDNEGLSQRSHIVSADLSYDLFPWLTIGGKYGIRLGEIEDRNDPDTSSGLSFTQMLTARADLHIIDKWDLLAAARMLNSPSANTTDYGTLLAVYRHVKDNFKLGVGYNFGSFSDDLRDITLNDQGAFVNLVGTY